MASNNNNLINATNDETEKKSRLMSKIAVLNEELLKEGLLNVKELCMVVFNMKYERLEKISDFIEKTWDIIEKLNKENKRLNKKIEELEDDLEEKTDDLKDDLRNYIDNKNKIMSESIENLQEDLKKINKNNGGFNNK